MDAQQRRGIDPVASPLLAVVLAYRGGMKMIPPAPPVLGPAMSAACILVGKAGFVLAGWITPELREETATCQEERANASEGSV
jgi:hypothetical protein